MSDQLEDERLQRAKALEQEAAQLRKAVEEDKLSKIKVLVVALRQEAFKLVGGASLYQGTSWTLKDEIERAIDDLAEVVGL